MFLAGIAVIIIQRFGRWSSEAFLEYIREQVESFTFGVSQRMLAFEHFHNLNLEDNRAAHRNTSPLPEIFVAPGSDREDGEGIRIEHHVQFAELSLDDTPHAPGRR